MQPIGKLLLICGLLLVAVPARASFTYVPVVQTAKGTTTCVFTNNVTNGDLIVVVSSWQTATGTPSVSDTRSTSYSQSFIDTSHTIKVAVYAGTLGSGGANTITFSESGEASQSEICVELKPLWTLTVDVSSDNTFGSVSTITSPSITTTLNDDLILGYVGGNSFNGKITLQSADTSIGSTFGSFLTESAGLKFAGANGSYSMSFNNQTATTTSGTVLIVAFKSISGITIQSPTALPDGSLTNAYDYKLQATGGVGSYTWSITSGSLQPGLSLNTSTGEITGTPTSGPTNTITFHVTDGTNTADLTSATLKVSSSANTITFVQGKTNASTTTSQAFASNVSIGDMVIAVLVNDNSPAYQGKILNCTDTLGTPLQLFTIADTYDLLSNQVDVFAGIAPSTGADSVSCTGVAINNLTIAEFSNVQYFGNDNALDTTGTAAGSPITSNSLTTLVPNEVLFSVAAPGTGTATLGVSSPFTTTSSNANTNTAPEYDIVTTVTGYTSSFTISGNTGNKWAIALAGFRPGGGVVAPAGGFRHQLIDN